MTSSTSVKRNPSFIREELTKKMDDLKKVEAHCMGCISNCCTFEYNSMQVTINEAYDLYLYLKENNLITDNLVAKLNETIKRYRLDKEIPSNGKKSYVRRTYTCPFFLDPGCSIPNHAKPFGCLAYNPTKSDIKNGVSEGYCFSEQKLLENESLYLDQLFNFDWEKKPIPNALLFFIENLS